MTAEGVALFRAIESERDPTTRVLDDPFAKWFLSRPSRVLLTSWRIGGPTSKVVDRVDPGLQTYIACRHRYLDDRLLGSLGTVDQVLVLGAGYDMRAWRFADVIGERPVFEVDLQAIGDRKQRILDAHRDELAHVDRRRVVIDFEAQSLAEVLEPAGFAVGAPTFVVWEGVAMYLTRAAVTDTLAALADLVGPGSELAMDMCYVIDDPSLLGSANRSALNVLSLIGEAITFPIHPDEVGFFLGRFGWGLVETTDHDQLRARYAPDRSMPPSGYVLAATRH